MIATDAGFTATFAAKPANPFACGTQVAFCRALQEHTARRTDSGRLRRLGLPPVGFARLSASPPAHLTSNLTRAAPPPGMTGSTATSPPAVIAVLLSLVLFSATSSAQGHGNPANPDDAGVYQRLPLVSKAKGAPTYPSDAVGPSDAWRLSAAVAGGVTRCPHQRPPARQKPSCRCFHPASTRPLRGDTTHAHGTRARSWAASNAPEGGHALSVRCRHTSL